MRWGWRTYLLFVIVGAALVFIVYALVTTSPVPKAAQPPTLSTAPARVYGRVEPAGREVFVGPEVTGLVSAIWVREGDTVGKGQKICALSNSVQTAELNLALAKLEATGRVLAISRDDFKRKMSLYQSNAAPEFDYAQALLKVQLDSANVIAAAREVDLARSRLDQLELRSPVDGKVYKVDVRLGDTLSPGDNSRIILGSPHLWVRLFVESFWAGRVKIGSTYTIYDSETNAKIGLGRVIQKGLFLTRRDFRTEEVQERFDTGFQEVVLSLEGNPDDVPLGLSVVAELSKQSR